ncbi:MAG TPA: hypothetical protein VFB21_05995 [Chthonomonadaceae bacterium]|nr:hypothetical protein [Chthonomonadaceae bacterium]
MAEGEINTRYDILDGVRIYMTNPTRRHQRILNNWCLPGTDYGRRHFRTVSRNIHIQQIAQQVREIMTLTIELSPKIEAQLREIAQEQGVEISDLATRWVEFLMHVVLEEISPTEKETFRKALAEVSADAQPLLYELLDRAMQRTAKMQKIRSLHGRFANIPTTVDDFCREKQEETAREEARA